MTPEVVLALDSHGPRLRANCTEAEAVGVGVEYMGHEGRHCHYVKRRHALSTCTGHCLSVCVVRTQPAHHRGDLPRRVDRDIVDAREQAMLVELFVPHAITYVEDYRAAQEEGLELVCISDRRRVEKIFVRALINERHETLMLLEAALLM
eukprot:CAMPEP_0174697782 /NCGR_PEP_ID=MMETSP1094-20130205/3550_1 /TAXON_ID=156173 /ORGANISM="Chrysochromulina brevifilum, Strain UTEX LB 985" /LENGTH=149 /DNA_ID=CAMNT_0015894831 /DNA_START=434 /DNA_END=883 /DNA_ORIENTATION=+